MTAKETFLIKALSIFKEMVEHGECSTQDISYFCGMSKYELERRGANVDGKRWLTKKEASLLLRVSTSTFDRLVLRDRLPRGKKLVGRKALVWLRDDIEQLKHAILLKGR